MAVTQAEIDALEKALRSGSLSVRHGDTAITYRSASEIRAILADMKAELAGRSRRSVAKFSRGF